MKTNIDDQAEKSEAVQESFPPAPGPIGIFDSGYGGLTILHGIRQLLPQYDYIYLGDNSSMNLRVRPYRSSSRWAVSW